MSTRVDATDEISMWQGFWRWFKKQQASFYIGTSFLVIVGLIITIFPFTSSYDPYSQNLAAGYLTPLSSVGDKYYLLGTDTLGRDYLSRIVRGAQVSALIGLSAVGISLVVGLALGLIAGFWRGWVETAIMGLADLQLAIPRILLLITVTAILGPSALTLAVLLGLTSWVAYGRVARAMTLTLREREFVLAAKTHGASSYWNIRHHLLPNVIPQMVIVGSYELGQIIVLEASLSYLGLGIQPPLPSLGLMVSEGQIYLQLNPWMAVLPGIAIFLMVAGIQFVSQGFTTEGHDDGLGKR